MAAYQKAAQVFGDDNFVFVAYDDPELLTPDGDGPRGRAGRGGRPGADRERAPGRVARRDAAALEDRRLLLALDRLPGVLPQPALAIGADRRVKNLDLKNERDDRRRRGPRGEDDPAALAALKERMTRHPLFRGTVIDGSATTTAVVVRLTKTGEHDVEETIAALRRAADRFAATHQLGRPAVVGPPVLLADGFTSIELDGRRLAGGRDAPDRPGDALGGPEPLVGDRPDPARAGWSGSRPRRSWRRSTSSCRSRAGPLVAQIIVLTMPAASHLAIHFRDDRRREADPRVAARVDPPRRRGADPLVRDHRRDRLRGPGHQRRRPDPAVRRDPGHLHAGRRPAGDGDLADRDAARRSPWRSPSATAPSRGSAAR